MDRSSQSGTSSQTESKRQESDRMVEKAKQEGQSFLEERKRATADEIGAVAEILRKATQEMHQQKQPSMVVSYAERTADRLDQYSRTLQERDLNTLVRQAEGFARRQPGVFVGGAVVAGFLLARFFRSSALHGEYDYPYSSQTGGESNPGYRSAAGTTAQPQAGRATRTPAPVSNTATVGSSTAARSPRSTSTQRKGEK